jgi:O-antigen/teichoic acid export membrane protein
MSISEYSILAVLLAIITTITDLAGTGYYGALIRYTARYKAEKNQDGINKLCSTTLANIIVLSILSIVIVCCLSGVLSKGLFTKNISGLICLAAFGIPPVFILAFYNSLLQGLQNFTGSFFVTISSTIIKCIFIGLIFFISKMTISQVLWIFILSPIVGIFVGFSITRDIKINLLNYDKQTLITIMQFGKWMMLWSIVNIIQSKLDVYLLGPLSKHDQVAYFDIAQKFISVVLVPFVAYGTVLTPRLAGVLDISSLLKEKKRANKISLLLTLGILICFLIVPWIIQIIFNDKYMNSLLPFKIMVLSLIPFVLTMPYMSALSAMGKSVVFFIMASIGLVLNTILSVFLIPKYGAIGSSISFAILNVLSLPLSIIFFNFYLKGKMREKPILINI